MARFFQAAAAACNPPNSASPDGPRRHPGLRREEVAVLAGVSVSWYTWLEQGRDIQPSADALRRISRVLKLDTVESAHLFALSSRELSQVATGSGVTEGLERLVRSIVPAYVRNTRLDILAWNDAIADLFVDCHGSLEPHERNTLRLLFLYKPYRTLILDWSR